MKYDENVGGVNSTYDKKNPYKIFFRRPDEMYLTHLGVDLGQY
jgi:hypothetical protein